MFFLNDQTDTNTIDFSNLKYIFINLFGNDFNYEFTTEQIQVLINTFYKFEPNITTEPYTQQFHVLYLIGHTLHKYNNENLNMETTDFYDKFYYPNMVSILSSHMKDAKKVLNKIIKEIFDEVKERCYDVVEFYLVFFNCDSSVIKNDILNIFLNTVFLDNDPNDMDNIRKYYESNFRFLFYAYLKNKTAGLLTFDIELREDHMLSMSTRYKIYEDGIRITQIYELCNKPNTHQRILQNYNDLKSDIITNELQKFYLYTTNKTTTTDNKMSLLSTFDNDGLDNIKTDLQLIYNLLRSLHIRSKESLLDDNFKQLIYKSMYDVLYIEFSRHLAKEVAINLANNIARKITISLTNGQYIDPLTLDPVAIDDDKFITQLKTFLELLVKNVSK